MVLVRMLPPPALSTVLYTPSRDDVAGRAEVLRLGPECRFLEVGQTVLLNSLLGTDMPDGHKLINEADVVATLPA